MKVFRIKKHLEWGEMTLVEVETNKEYTLTDMKTLFSEDFYTVRRFVAYHNVPANVVPDKEFFMYMFSFMPDGYSSTSYIVDEDAAMKIIGSNLEGFIRGEAYDYLKNLDLKIFI